MTRSITNLSIKDSLNVKDFGAKGDGVTDDTAKIAACIAATSSYGRYIVYFPEGTYVVSSTITVPTGVTLQGSAWASYALTRSKILAKSGFVADSPIFLFNDKYASIQNLTIDLQNQQIVGVYLYGAHYAKIVDCWFYRGAVGGIGIKAGGALYPKISHCVWNVFAGVAIKALNSYSSNPSATYYGINVGIVDDCYFYCSDSSIVVEGFLTIKRCDFEGAIVNTSSNYGVINLVSPDASTYAIVDDCYFELIDGMGYKPAVAFGLDDYTSIAARNNMILGHTSSTVGSAAFWNYAAIGLGHFNIQDNYISRFESPALKIGIISGGSINVTGNRTFLCGISTLFDATSPITTKGVVPSTELTGRLPYSVVNSGAHTFIGSGGLVTDLCLHTDASHPTKSTITLDVAGGYWHQFSSTYGTTDYGKITTLNNEKPGQLFYVSARKPGLELPNSIFNLREATNVCLRENEIRLFWCDYYGTVREIYPTGMVCESRCETPINATHTQTTGGFLADATYSYRVVATNSRGKTLASTATTIAVSGGLGTAAVNVNWNKVPGATGYEIYGRTSGTEFYIVSVGDVATYKDTGSITPTGAVPVGNTTGIATVPNDLSVTRYLGIASNKVIYGSAAPTTGTWVQGDVCFSTVAASGLCVGWVCVSGGSPGIWKEFGQIECASQYIVIPFTNSNLGSTLSSTTQVPAGAYVTKSTVVVSTHFTYTVTPTLTSQIYNLGGSTTIRTTASQDLTTITDDDQFLEPNTYRVTNAGPVQITLAGTASAGAGYILVEYVIPRT